LKIFNLKDNFKVWLILDAKVLFDAYSCRNFSDVKFGIHILIAF